MDHHIIDLHAEPEHIPTLAEWHHTEWAHLNPDRTLEERIDYIQQSLGDGTIPSTYIYKLDNKLAGSASLVIHDMPTRLELSPWLASVFVKPEFRNRGIGSKLVRKIMDVARQAKTAELYLFTPNKEDFYRKLSWETLSKEDYQGTDITIMKIILR